MDFNFRKISAVIASAVMVGSSLGMAAAANYPAPFVSNGAANVAVVWGSGASAADLAQASAINVDLQYRIGGGTTTTTTSSSGGDSVNLGSSSRSVYYSDALNVAKQTLSATEMPNVLADGKVIDLKGVEYKYTQQLVPGTTVSAFGTSGGDVSDPVLHFQIGTTATSPLYNYTLSFQKNLNVTDDTNVQGQKLKVLGVDYVIGASSTNTSLYLYGAGESITLVGGESKNLSIGGKDHIVELVAATGATTVKLTVDGVSKTVTKGSSYSYAGDLNVYVRDVTYQSYAGGAQTADLIIGANTLLIANGASVKQGADQTSIQGTNGVVTASGTGQISGFTVQVAAQKAQYDHIAAGGSFTDPIFGGLKLQFASANPDFNSSARATIKVDTNDQDVAYVTFTKANGVEKRQQYVYDNNSASTAITPLLALRTISANAQGAIHVLEGEQALLRDGIVINKGDAGTIIEVTDIASTSSGSATTCDVTFTDAFDSTSAVKISLTNATSYFSRTTSMFGGSDYTVRADGACTSTSYVNVTWNSDLTQKYLFPRIKLKDGSWIALLQQQTLANGTTYIFPDGSTTLSTTGTQLLAINGTIGRMFNGINWTLNNTGVTLLSPIVTGINNPSCEFNATKGPAILYIQPKKWNDASQGNFICVPMTTTGTTKIAIGDPVFNGTNSGFVTYNSDTYKKAAIDQYGAFVTKEDRTNQDGVATISTPASQMSLDVLFTAPSTVVSAGSIGGAGSGTRLGNVVVTDAEINNVKDKNLIVVGGSCINTVAASLLDSTTPLCGAEFTTKTTVGSGQFLIQSIGDKFTAGKIAVIVAGYDAEDTKNAATYLTSNAVDLTAGKKWVSTSSTTAQLV